MSAPDVAVLMAVYQNDSLGPFRRAVESLLDQDYPRERIHIYLGVDGPLADDVAAYVRKAKCFHKIVRNPRNIGLTRTLNRLIKALADEEFIFRMDADDVSLPGRFACQVKFLREHPDIDAIGGSVIEIDRDGRQQFVRHFPTDPDEIPWYICKATPLGHVTICLRRRFFQKVPAYPEQYRQSQDIALWFRALAAGMRLSNVTEPVCVLLLSGELLARRGIRKAFTEFSIYLRGIWRLHGLTWRYVYPIARLLVRLLPAEWTARIYRSRIRSSLNEPQGPRADQEGASAGRTSTK